MKILVVGIGRCGGRIADEFERLNKKARSTRGIEIITGTFAVDTDTAALSELNSIKADYRRRILVGVKENSGRGMVSVNEIGAEIAKREADKILDAIRLVKRYPETDAILVVASGAGGTGSGAMPIMIQNMKERYKDKAVYGLVVFPFEREVQTDKRFIFNTATCLKSSYAISDAILLVDNQKYIQQDSFLIYDMMKLNELIIEPFYNLLCAGEEKKPSHIGSKLIDAGDVIQTVKGWTTLGHGESPLSLIRHLLKRPLNLEKKRAESDTEIKVMEEAISNLSVKCDPSYAAAALYLVSAPAREITMNFLEYLGDYMKSLAVNAVIRSGDYPIRRRMMGIDVILSQLENVDKVREFYEMSADVTKRTPDYLSRNKE
jgi:cell division GTPase FtsZ